MHTYKNLYEKVYDFQNLYDAYLSARRGRRSRDVVVRYELNLEEELITLQNELIYQTYRPGRYRAFYTHDGKTRLILAAPFRDRVLHHAIASVIEPIFEAGYYAHSYACRPGKGTLAGIRQLEKMLHSFGDKKVYCLQADIRHYFASIDHDILKKLLRKKIGDRQLLWLLDTIIDSTNNNETERQYGIPLGSYTSQIFANIYLTELDRFIKQDLHIKHYLRYMDDFIILSTDKRELHEARRRIGAFLEDKLLLELNRKTSIFPASAGIDTLGYRIFPKKRILRKRMIRKMRRALKIMRGNGNLRSQHNKSVIASWLGIVRLSDTPKLKGAFTRIAKAWFGVESKKNRERSMP